MPPVDRTNDMIVYLVDVGFDGEGYSRRTFRIPIYAGYRGEGDNGAKRVAAEQEAIAAYTKSVSARVIQVLP